jgi:hypothetical protein
MTTIHSFRTTTMIKNLNEYAPEAIIILDHQKKNACKDARVKNINTLLDKSSSTTK